MESVQGTKISSVSLAFYLHESRDGETLAGAPDEIGVLYEIEANRAVLYCGPPRMERTVPLARWSLTAASPPGALMVQPIQSLARPFLLRCDRVDFPLGGVAYAHTHRGPGIRMLLAGELRVTTAGKTLVVRPGEAWFESGPEPVFAQASERTLTSFVRVMILPPEILGKSSIRYVNPADQEKPKTQSYTVFIDEVIAA